MIPFCFLLFLKVLSGRRAPSFFGGDEKIAMLRATLGCFRGRGETVFGRASLKVLSLVGLISNMNYGLGRSGTRKRRKNLCIPKEKDRLSHPKGQESLSLWHWSKEGVVSICLPWLDESDERDRHSEHAWQHLVDELQPSVTGCE